MPVILFLLFPFLFFGETLALYLSWYSDPTSTITIQWHSPEEKLDPYCSLILPSGEVKKHTASFRKVSTHLVYTVEIVDLMQDTEYTFQIAKDPAFYKFRTAPTDLQKSFRFIIGGDVYLSKDTFRKMAPSIIEQNPLFAVIGGDIAYAINVNPFSYPFSPIERWFHFLKDWKERMITPEGRVIPFVLAAGNHDLSPKKKENFFDLFAFKEKIVYRTLDFGNYLSLILLDTGHLSPIVGEQTEWLKKALEHSKTFFYHFPIYHIAAYPSSYDYAGKTPQLIRETWCPLFDQFQMPVAFEHHNHAWKRTYPIKANKIDPTGTVYLGDGAWGVDPYKVHDGWYLEKKESVNNVYVVELTLEKALIKAMGLGSRTIDQMVLENIPLVVQ